MIYFDFKNKKVVEEKLESESVKEKEVDEKMSGKTGHYAEFIQFLISGSAKKLMSLRVSPTSLHQYCELVKSYDTKDLIGWLEKTNENDWEKKASFFQAIFGELKSRLNIK